LTVPGCETGRVKVALVTGAGRRLGRELALGLGQAGYRVAVHYRSDRTAAEETLALLSAGGAEGAAIRADLAAPGAAARLVEEVLERFGSPDVLVHSASPWVEKPPDEVSEADWDTTFAVAPKAAFFLVQAARAHLARSEGAVLLVSDVAAQKAWPLHLPHAVAKAAIDALVRTLAVALGPAVRVNGIAPGIVLPPPGMLPGEVDRLVARTPLRRLVSVADVVSAALHLVGNRSITGQVLAVDAGRSVV